VTSDIARRAWEHRSDAVDGFTRRYGVHQLVFTEFHGTMAAAILREKRIKKWRRAWKLVVIERDNPQWRDLYQDLLL
jgi:putative endonuclease